MNGEMIHLLRRRERTCPCHHSPRFPPCAADNVVAPQNFFLIFPPFTFGAGKRITRTREREEKRRGHGGSIKPSSLLLITLISLLLRSGCMPNGRMSSTAERSLIRSDDKDLGGVRAAFIHGHAWDSILYYKENALPMYAREA